MKILIDISDETFTRIKNHNVNLKHLEIMCESVFNGIRIPDNATNGDVIETLFGNDYSAKKSWWNAPYQRGGKE